MTNFYSKTTGSTDFYNISSSTTTEVDIRQEFINFLDGNNPEIAKAQTGLLRKMRRDDDNKLVPCECVDPISKEPEKDRICPICMGVGFKWDESIIKFYKTLEATDVVNTKNDKLTKAGLINSPSVVFYIRYDVDITRDDEIVVLELNTAGTASYTRKAIYRIVSLWDFRSDNGRIEYYKAYVHEVKYKYLNMPNYEDVL